MMPILTAYLDFAKWDAEVRTSSSRAQPQSLGGPA